MSYKLYTAPNCLRCKIVKQFMADQDVGYDAYDFRDDKEIFNAFYRANRAAIYRNPEGVEFPLLHNRDADVIRQGSGEIIAYLLSGRALESCVQRSDLLHGWISGLHVSCCPEGLEDTFVRLVEFLVRGGLQAQLETDGRNPKLLGRLLEEKLAARVVLSLPGPAEVYPDAVGEALLEEDLAKSLLLVRNYPEHTVRLLLRPLTPQNGQPYYITPAQGAEAGKMLSAAGADMQMSFSIELSTQTVDGLKPLLADGLLPYRSGLRNYLVKAEIAKLAS